MLTPPANGYLAQSPTPRSRVPRGAGSKGKAVAGSPLGLLDDNGRDGDSGGGGLENKRQFREADCWGDRSIEKGLAGSCRKGLEVEECGKSGRIYVLFLGETYSGVGMDQSSRLWRTHSLVGFDPRGTLLLVRLILLLHCSWGSFNEPFAKWSQNAPMEEMLRFRLLGK